MRIFDLLTNAIRSRLALKFVLAIAGMAAILLAISAVVLDTRTSAALEGEINAQLTTLAEVEGREIGTVLADQELLVRTLVSFDSNILATLEASNQQFAGSDPALITQELLALDAEWTAAEGSTNELIEATVNNPISDKLRSFIQEFPDHAEIFITDRHGAEIAGSGRTSDYYQADEAWWQAGYNDGNGAIFISSPELDESAGVVAIEITFPVISPQTEEVLGVVKSVYNITSLIEEVGAFQFGETGRARIVDADGRFVATSTLEAVGSPAPESELLDGAVFDGVGFGLDVVNASGDTVVLGYAPINSRGRVPEIDNLGWVVLVEQAQSEAFAPIAEERTTLAVTTTVVVIVFALLALFLTRTLTGGLANLTQASRRLGAGDFDARAKVTSRDEIGQMANSFNNMASQIQARDAELAERLTDLQTAFDVNEQISTIFNLDRLLQDVADLTKERFGLYHSHIYVYRPEEEALLLTAGAGHVGRQMVAERRSIDFDKKDSIVAQAARTRQPVVINDVSQSGTFLPHRLLPDTAAELAVPLVARGQLLGVLDVQADLVDFFDSESLGLMQLMGGQIATAISNANLYTAAQQASRFEQAIGRLDRQLQEALDVDDIVETAARELGVALRVSRSAVELALPNEAASIDEPHTTGSAGTNGSNGHSTEDPVASDEVQPEVGLD